MDSTNLQLQRALSTYKLYFRQSFPPYKLAQYSPDYLLGVLDRALKEGRPAPELAHQPVPGSVEEEPLPPQLPDQIREDLRQQYLAG